MTTYMQLDRCQVLCSCRCTNTLCRLYFCRHCLDIRCGDCVSHEVDSHYCPNCLENMASAEAKMRKHRCGNCFDCPSCGQVLSTRATAVMVPSQQADEQNKSVPQKAFYLACVFCRWTTRDSEIPDQRQPAGVWQEKENLHAKRISELIDSYHHLAVKEKSDREWSKFVRKRNYMMLLDRYPVLNPRLRSFCGSAWTTPNRNTEPEKPVNIPAAVAPSQTDHFDLKSHVGSPLKLELISNIQQRHLAPQFQPRLVSDLQPHPKCLAVKRSMRCRTCEHNLSKADFSPSSIKFRINLSAIYHVPEMRYFIPDTEISNASKFSSGFQRRTSATLTMMKSQRLLHHNLSAGKLQPFVLTLSNPAHRVTTVTIRQLTVEEEATDLQHLILSSTCNNKVQTTEPIVGSSGDVPPTPIFSTVQLTLPTVEIKLAPRNDIAEYDDQFTSSSSHGEPKDDPSVFVFRRSNKVGLRAALTPLGTPKYNRSTFTPLVPLIEEHALELAPSEQPMTIPLRAAVRLRFDYKNATTTSQLSDQRAAALAASAAAASASASATSAVKAGRDSVDAVGKLPPAVGGATQTEDQLNQIEVTVLMHFGEMPINDQ